MNNIEHILRGIDKTEKESIVGWWKTPRGASFGKCILRQAIEREDAQSAEIERLKADNARMLEVLDEIINAYDVANGEYFCLNCGLVIATYEERCSECGADLSIEYDGLIKKAKQALKGGE